MLKFFSNQLMPFLRLGLALIMLIIIIVILYRSFHSPHSTKLAYKEQNSDTFSLLKQDETYISPNDLKGSLYILAFISPSCSYCYKQMPNLTSINKERNVRIIGVLPGNYYGYLSPDILKYYTNMFDDVSFDINNNFNLSRLPQTYVFNKDKQLLYRKMGAISLEDADHIKSLIDKNP